MCALYEAEAFLTGTPATHPKTIARLSVVSHIVLAIVSEVGAIPSLAYRSRGGVGLAGECTWLNPRMARPPSVVDSGLAAFPEYSR